MILLLKTKPNITSFTLKLKNLMIFLFLIFTNNNILSQIMPTQFGFSNTIETSQSLNALRFSGTPDYATLPSGVYFNGDFTIEAWVYPTAFSNWSRIIDFGNGAGSNNVLLAYTYSSSGKPALYVEGTQFYVPDAIPLNQWTHIAATLNGTTATIYINGLAKATSNVPPPVNLVRTKNYIGRSNWGTGDPDASAIFDDLRIWSISRSESEIQSKMYTELIGTETGLEVYMTFNQGIACGDNTAITTIQDLAASGGYSNATLHSFEMNNGCESNLTQGVYFVVVKNKKTNQYGMCKVLVE